MPSAAAPRSSISSYPSIASSSSQRSRYSTLATETGEGSSRSSRRVLSSDYGRLSTTGDNGDATRPVSTSFLGDDLLENRRKRPRRSGGFLLESPFQGTVQDYNEHGRAREMQRQVDGVGKVKGKAKDKSESESTMFKELEEKKTKEKRKSRDKLKSVLSSTLKRSPAAKEQGHGDGHDIDMEEEVSSSTRSSSKPPAASEASSQDGVDMADAQVDGSMEPDPESLYFQRASIDPTQIVHMALNLSESRRRNVSAGQLAASKNNGRRVTSLTLPPATTALQGTYQGFNRVGSLRQTLNEQRRIARNISPSHTGRSSPRSRHASSPIPFEQEATIDYQFSAATLARAEKARAHIELGVEFRRLLQFLPPLKPDAAALGNFSHTTPGMFGSSNYQVVRTPTQANEKPELGRQYNPLQYVRNRKLRARTRKPLNPDTEEWNDPTRVSRWVDSVVDRSKRPAYRYEDGVRLPPYGDNETGELQNIELKAKRPRMDWITEPSGFLADAYWLEQRDNKFQIENRHGSKIFAKQASNFLQPPRQSHESVGGPHERRKSNSGSTLEITPERKSFESDQSNSVNGSERGRSGWRRTRSRDGSPRRHRILPWNRARSPSSSDLSVSAPEDGADPKKKKSDRKVIREDENIGPLELHMQGILEDRARRSISTDIASPGTPDKWGIGHTFTFPPREQDDESHTDERRGTMDTSLTTPSSNKHYQNALKDERPPRISLDDDDSTRPSTPGSSKKVVLPIAADLSPPASRRQSLSRRGSPTRKSKLSKLPFMRSGKAKDSRDDIDTVDFADHGSDKSSRHPSGETGEQSRSSLEKLRPPFAHKANGSVSSLSNRPESRGRRESKDLKEPQSAVTRFFKGGRIGELVRSETSKVGDVIWKKEPVIDQREGAEKMDELSTSSGSESDDENEHKKNRNIRDIGTGKDLSLDRKRSDKPKYHISNLPSFKRTAGADDDHSRDVSPGSDHITQQKLQQRQNRSPRFERLAPKIDLSRVTSASSAITEATSDTYTVAQQGSQFSSDLSRNHSRDDRVLTERLSVPGTVGRGGPLSNVLAKLPSSNRRASSGRRPSSVFDTNNRHWSIGDVDHAPHAPGVPVTKADIARIRTLLLCSGIKAARITQTAQAVRPNVPIFLRQAASTVGAELIQVPRKEEHVLAARILSTDLDNATALLKDAADNFRASTVHILEEQLEALRALVDRELTPTVLHCADEADKQMVELTEKHMLEVRNVNDMIDRLVRTRRRRMRWVRRAGFVLLEWMLLGVMWWAWLVVVVVRAVFTIFGGTWRTIKWLLFL